MRFEASTVILAGALIVGGCATTGTTAASAPLSTPTAQATTLPASTPPRAKKMNPRLKRFFAANTKAIDFAKSEQPNGYVGRIEFTENIAAMHQDLAREYFRNRVIESYMNEISTSAEFVGVSFVRDEAKGAVYSAEALAFELKDVTLAYNPDTRRGTLGMRLRDGDLEATRALIRKNIESIARDKNIRLTTGVLPPEGKFYLLNESIVNGNLLQVQFEVE